MPFSHFSIDQIAPLIVSGTIIVASILSFRKHKILSLVLLFIGSLGMGYFIANLDEFLNLWDEQYHALVAKNLAQNFLEPKLFLHPLMDFNFKDWTGNSLWLHKQPLFLWQMALSIKIFGTTAIAARVPSIIMHALIPLLIFRIGSIITDKTVGYIGGLLFALAYFPLELVAGGFPTDHNDVAFLFYVTASFWTWFEYEKSKNNYWLILIGIFSGGAVLVKWLMGLVVYVLWIITKFSLDSKTRFKPKSYLPLLYSGLISVLIFLPWQLYISYYYPLESTYEYQLNASHFFIAIEGHNDGRWFYFTDGLKRIYGTGILMAPLLLFGLALLIKNASTKVFKCFVLIAVSFVYLFYSIAATKMVAFPLIVAPFLFLGLGSLIASFFAWIEKRLNHKQLSHALTCTILVVIGFTSLHLGKIQNYHTGQKPHDNRKRAGEKTEMGFILSLDKTLDEPHVIFNASITLNGHIPIMYFTDHTAYNFIPSETQIAQITNQNVSIAILDLGNLPNYILSNPSIKRLTLKANEE